MRYRSVAFFSTLALCSAIVSPVCADDKAMDQWFDKYLQTEAGQEKLGKAVEGYFRKMQERAQKDEASRADAEIEAQFKNPVKIDLANAPTIGPANAKITIVEFSDFQCPFCSRGAKTVKEVMKAYPNDVKVAFKNLPLPFHQQAVPAAKAALAAGKQGKFWEMHDVLFENQQNLTDELFVAQAGKLGLNVEKFKTDMASEEIAKQIEADKALAEKQGIQGTPFFYVNGVAVRGAYPAEHFKKIVDRWLAGGAAPADKKS